MSIWSKRHQWNNFKVADPINTLKMKKYWCSKENRSHLIWEVRQVVFPSSRHSHPPWKIAYLHNVCKIKLKNKGCSGLNTGISFLSPLSLSAYRNRRQHFINLIGFSKLSFVFFVIVFWNHCNSSVCWSFIIMTIVYLGFIEAEKTQRI